MKKTYIVRVTTYKSIDDMDINELMHKMLSTGLPIHHAEIFDEKQFVRDVWDQSVWNEIDLDKLFFDILHMTEEEVDRYKGCENEENTD